MPLKRARGCRRLFTILSFILLVVFVPYLWSRWRQVTTHKVSNSSAAAGLQNMVESQDQKLKLLGYNIAHG